MKRLKKYLWIILGNITYIIGLNIFITPIGLYSGGIYGICQLIRTGLADFISYNIDIAGILYLLFNIPLLIIAFKYVGKSFFINTVLSVIVTNVLLIFVVIKEPLISDPLTSCIIGGLLCGVGAGIVLRSGSCGGGTEIIGIYFLKKDKRILVGQINLMVNIGVYALCAYLFNFETAIYSIIFSAITSLFIDKFHEQNIKINALIFTDNYEITKTIETKLNRGSTSWEGKGDYTGNKKYIISTVISKYEASELKTIIKTMDENAFVIFNNKIDTLGYLQKHLDA